MGVSIVWLISGGIFLFVTKGQRKAVLERYSYAAHVTAPQGFFFSMLLYFLLRRPISISIPYPFYFPMVGSIVAV